MSKADFHLMAVVESMITMSGGFSEESNPELYEYWVTHARPRLFAALEYMYEEVE